MSIEAIVQLLAGNAVGVAFGVLMYRMATDTIAKHTIEIKRMNETLLRLVERLR